MTSAPDLRQGLYDSVREAQPPTTSQEKLEPTPNAGTDEDTPSAGLQNPIGTAEIANELEKLKQQKREIVSALLGEAPPANGFSEHLHRLYRLNIRYHRISLIKHCVKLRSLDTLSQDGTYRYIQDCDMQTLETDLRLHCK